MSIKNSKRNNFLKAVGTCLAGAFLMHNAYALDAFSAASATRQKVVKSVVKALDLDPQNGAIDGKIYDRISFAFAPGWHSYWMGNEDPSDGKIKNSAFRVVDLIVVNDNRVNDITFNYFPVEHRIFMVRRQFVEGSSDAVLTQASRRRNAPSVYSKVGEDDSYAFFHKKNYMNFSIFHVKNQNGSATYIDYLEFGVGG